VTPWINYHHLYYFMTIAEQGTVVKAAQKLRLGQPTLSAQLKQFEDNLGVSLFERQHKRLVLTELGKVALEYARSIFKLGSEMLEVLHDRMHPLLPTLHIGALDTIPKRIVLQMTKQALKISDCQITLSEGNLEPLLRDLTSHRMDLLVSNRLPSGIDGKGLFPKLLTKKNIVFYGAPKFKELKKDFPHSISGVPVILPTHDCKLRYDIDHWAKSNQIDLNIVVESQDISMKKLLAVDGIGLVPTTDVSVARHLRLKDLVAIGSAKGVYEEIFVISAQRKLTNRIAAILMKEFVL
jgi:LysR family transcriptional regulator, transcriptional activator of nhaA